MLRLTIICIVLVAATALLAVAQPPANLVRNPGFEQVAGDKPAAWVLGGSAVLDNAQFYSGAMGLHFAHAAVASSNARQNVPLEVKDYLAVVWVRLEHVDGVGVLVRVLDQAGQALATSRPLVGESGWQRVAVPFRPAAAGNATLEIALLQAKGDAWIDEVLVGDAATVGPTLQTGPAPADARTNLALGKPYELSPPPSYDLCTDPGDVTQLTDGQYTVGYFWTQKSTVGWYLYDPQITVDLGQVQPISGIMINCPGGGVAGVQFPAEINLLVSDDNQSFREVSRLTPRGLRQDGKNWYTHRFLADNLRTRGRYVMIRLTKTGSTVFTDEIEVYRGDFDPASVAFTTPGRSRLEMSYGQYSLKPTTYTRGHFPETPHVKWALPLAGGPIKSIVMAYSDDLRDVCEIAQRFDLDYVPVSHYSFYRPEALGNLMQEQIAGALPTCQVMIAGGFRWEAMPQALLAQIKARVRAGMGLVLVSSYPAFMGPVQDLLAEQPLAGDQGLLDLVPMTMLPQYRQPKSHLHLARYGQGRVALVNPGEFTRPAHSLLPMYQLSDVDDDVNTPLEYYYVALAKVAIWAAGRDAHLLQQLAITGDHVVIQSAATADAKLEATFRDPCFDPVKSVTLDAPAAGGAVSVPLPDLPTGANAVDVCLRDGQGRIVDFGSVACPVSHDARVDSIALDQPVYAPGAPIVATVKLAGNLERLRLAARLVDTYGRQLAPVVAAPVTGDTMTLTVPPGPPLTLGADLHISLLQGDRVLEKRRQRVWLDLPERDDYTFMAWYAWEFQPHAYWGNRMLNELGVDSYVSLPGTWRAENAAYGNVRHGPENVSRVAPEKMDDSRVRVPCLTDPAFRAKTAERITKLATEVRPYGVVEWSLGDESTLGHRDYCTSPTCLTAFRDVLVRQYQTLDALNSSWGSHFAAWDEVMPSTLADVAGKPNLGSWLDHRRYMESLFAEYHDWCKNLIVKQIPAARVGISGTPNVNSYSGHDWWKLMQGPLTHLSGYGGIQREMQRSFTRPGTFVSTFLGYDYRDSNEQRARYSAWDLLFHGSNGINYYTLMSNTLNCPLLRPDMTLTDKAPWFFEETRELKAGMGRLFMCARYANDGIAVHYSPASIHAATACGLFDNRDRLRRYDTNLNNVGKILQQLHLQYDFVHEAQMAQGALAKYKVLMLPWASALSPREAQAIRAFVQGGGTVIADAYCGVRDDHGQSQAMLDDLLGVKQTLQPPDLKPATVAWTPAAGTGWTAALAQQADQVWIASGAADLELAGGQALAQIAGQPAIIIKRTGKGQTIFVNGGFSNYAETWATGVAEEVLEEEEAPSAVTAPIRRLMLAMLNAGGVAVPVTVAAGDDTQVELSRLNLDGAQLLGVVRAITAGAIDRQDLLACELSLPAPAHVYESRSGKYLGRVAAIADKLPRGVARVYAMLPYQLAKLTLTAPAEAKIGQPISLALAVVPTGTAKPITHVVHLSVSGPDGQERRWYGQNVILKAGRGSATVPLAWNDQPGQWSITATDIATGLKATQRVTVR
ncbi:MAG: beta-galactosidase [Armatimonadetes bacterium]|nr:beta-galactosidase [Armatimonadota bacterium]